MPRCAGLVPTHKAHHRLHYFTVVHVWMMQQHMGLLGAQSMAVSSGTSCFQKDEDKCRNAESRGTAELSGEATYHDEEFEPLIGRHRAAQVQEGRVVHKALELWVRSRQGIDSCSCPSILMQSCTFCHSLAAYIGVNWLVRLQQDLGFSLNRGNCVRQGRCLSSIGRFCHH